MGPSEKWYIARSLDARVSLDRQAALSNPPKQGIGSFPDS